MLTSLHLQPLLHGCLAVGVYLWQFLVVFFNRHWLVALANAGITVLVGLALLWVAARFWPLRTSSLLYLRLRRLVYFVALAKGAFYLIFGENLSVNKGAPLGWGCQFAPASMIDFFQRQQYYSIFHPRPETFTVTLLLVGVALLLFAFRAYRVAVSSRALEALDQIYGGNDPRADEALSRAAAALGIGPKVVLPRILLVEVQCATPLLLGVRNPRLLISPKLMACLADEELEMAFRHELAHFKRRDHWWRWIQLWIEDIARVTFVSGRLAERCVETEELLCDRLAVKSPKDALALANAIAKAAKFMKGSLPEDPDDKDPDGESPGGAGFSSISSPAQIVLPAAVVPSLLGRHQATISEASCLERRIRQLLFLSEGMSAATPRRSKAKQLLLFALRAVEFPLFLLVSVLLFAVLYAKFHFLLNIN